MKVFLDSSVLIEYENGRNKDLLSLLYENRNITLCINSIVTSEYLYKLLGIISGKSPMSICESKQISKVLSYHNTSEFLSYFSLLDIPKEAILLGLNYMKKYNLLPNDSIILACCKIQNISFFASLDSDFIEICKSEKINLLNTIELAKLIK